MLRNRNAPHPLIVNLCSTSTYNRKKTKIFVYIGPRIADNLYMQNKYEIANDAFKFGDLVYSIELSQGREAWDYFWRDNTIDTDWVTGNTDPHASYFSSKEAAKRGISRLTKTNPEIWKNCEFIVAKIASL